jgi:hypothetical protein
MILWVSEVNLNTLGARRQPAVQAGLVEGLAPTLHLRNKGFHYGLPGGNLYGLSSNGWRHQVMGI